MTAFSFVLMMEGRVQGHAVVCPSARFASVMPTGVQRIDRKFAHVDTWLGVDRQIAERLPSGALAPDSAIVRLLLAPFWRTSITVRFLASTEIDVKPAHVAERLDAQLRGLSAMPALGQKLSRER